MGKIVVVATLLASLNQRVGGSIPSRRTKLRSDQGKHEGHDAGSALREVVNELLQACNAASGSSSTALLERLTPCIAVLRREPSPALVRSQSESAKAQPEDDLDYLEAVRLLSEDAHGRDLLSLSRSDIRSFWPINLTATGRPRGRPGV